MVGPEMLAMRACSKSLIDSLAEEDIDSIADDLHSRKLISNDVKEALALPKTKKVKAREVMANVVGKVNASPKNNFVSFIQVLIDNDLPHLAQMLGDKYVEEGGDKSNLPVIQSKDAEGASGSSGTDEGASSRKRLVEDRESTMSDGLKVKRPRGSESRVQPDSQECADDNDGHDNQNNSLERDHDDSSKTPAAHEEMPYKDLRCSEIKSSKPKRQGFDYDEFCKRVEYIIAVINDNEFNAATTVISSPEEEPGSGQLTSFQVCVYLGKIGQHPVGLIHCEPGRECATTLNECINYFPNAKFLIGAGVCYGFDYDKVKFGDVIISKRIEDFGSGKIGEISIESRGPQINMLPKIKEIFCTNPSVENGFPVASLVNFPSSVRLARYHVGTVISHTLLLNDKDTKKKFQNESPNAYGGEMEGGELLRIQQEKKIQVIIIKAVTDYGDGTKGKEWQFIGAQAAFNYVKCKMSRQSVSEVEQGRITPGQQTVARQNKEETARYFGAASTERIRTDGEPFSTEDDEADVVVPMSLEEKDHIEKYKKAVRTIPKANRDMLKKEFPPGENLCKVAEKINSDWKTKFYLLSLEKSDVDNIMEGRNRDNPVGQRIEALEIWRNKAWPTYEDLLIILIKGNWKDAEDFFVRLCTK